MRSTQKKRGLKSAAASSLKSSIPSSARRRVRRSPSLGSPTPSEAASSTSPASTATKARKRPRILSGLHPSQDILDGVRPPWEMEEPASTVPHSSSRYTRGQKNGYKEGVYDMKFHPMDKTTRPKMAAKREQKLKALSTRDVSSAEEGSEDENSHITLSDGSGSDLEDSEQSDDEDKSPVVLIKRPISTQERRSGRLKLHRKPLYSSKKHPIDELVDSDDEIRPGKKRKIYQSIDHDSDPPPKPLTQKRKSRGSFGTAHGVMLKHTSSRRTKGSGNQNVHAKSAATAAAAGSDDSPQPMPGTYPPSSSPMATYQLGDISTFPENPPASMKETLQRVEAVMREVSMLIPQFPAIEAHLKKSLAVQVHEDTTEAYNAANRTHARFPLARSDDFEKENVRNVSRESSGAVNDAFGDEEIMGNRSSDGAEDEGHGMHNIQQVGGQDRLDSSELMPPPPLPSRSRPHGRIENLPECPSGTELPELLSSALYQSSTGQGSSDYQRPRTFRRTTELRLQDPPSTGGTPAHSQDNDDSQPLGRFSSSRTVSVDHESTIKDTHLTVSQSAAIQSSQAEESQTEESQTEESQMEESQYPPSGLDNSDFLNSDESQHFNDAIYPR